MNDQRRITLLTRGATTASRTWNLSTKSQNRVIFVNAFSMLPHTLEHTSQDIERILIDCSVSATSYLEFLSQLPPDFLGDVVYMCGEHNSFLSSAGRGGDRLLYTLTPADLEFY